MNRFRNIRFKRLQTLWLLLAWVAMSAQAGQSWSVLTSMSYNQGKYIYDDTVENLYLNLGVRYRQPNWSLTISLPVIGQQDNNDANSGVLIDSLASAMGFLHDQNIDMGLGDLYIFGQRKLWKSPRGKTQLSATFQLKYPLGFSSEMFSSQQIDYGAGISLRQSWGPNSLYGDIGYLVLGSPDWGEYSNPVSYGIGMGRSFLRKMVVTSIYYREYTEILAGLIPPKQVSVGISARLTYRTYISLNLTQGLSESSPDSGVTSGIVWKI